MPKEFLSIDPSQLPKHFDSKESEKKWDQTWQTKKVYEYEAPSTRDQSFVIDTPPPTVSGSLHIGHVFSYTQTDIVARYKRMCGKNVFYPLGWDDNGLPTERRVQNYFHVRCDPKLAYQKDLKIESPTKEQEKEHPRVVSRENFIELCHRVTQEDEKTFEDLYRRIGLSIDWREVYATIDDRCRKISQLSFLDLFQKNHIYNLESPTMWDVDFQTAVAQAEVEDRQQGSAFHNIEFSMQDSKQSFVIATTRPELLPACIGVAAHPDDERYKNLFGRRALTPLFRVPVPVFSSELADPEKGTGILMVCSFGDATDVQWWKEKKLHLRQIIGKNGRLLPVDFKSAQWPSSTPEEAQKFYDQLAGKNVKQARNAIVELLRLPDASAAKDSKAPLQGEPKPLEHAVKFFEKGDRPLEFVTTRQWFVALLKQKEALLKKGDEIKWFPDFMRSRFRNWTENLQFDWCISRQRYFGVPIPVWYPIDTEGCVLYDRAILPESDQLPVDPMIHSPKNFSEAQRDQVGGFCADPDVFDTWFTSSLTPMITAKWGLDERRFKQLYPADIRPQAHEIIRTWAFYTIAKSLLHKNSIPWKNALISGWILDPDRKKMSKSKGNAVTPIHLLDEYSSDAVRYWAGSARLGVDTAFDEQTIKIGKRLTTKIYNASKFVLMQKSKLGSVTQSLDLSFLKALHQLVETSTKSMEQFNYAQCLQDTERFFWSNFTDTYIEIVKVRAKEGTEEQKISAVASLRLGLSVLLRLFAPHLPFVTEEIWSWAFAQEMDHPSIHKSLWPSAKDFELLNLPATSEEFENAVALYSAINKFKTTNNISIGAPVKFLKITAQQEKFDAIKSSLQDIFGATKLGRHEFHARAAEGFEVSAN